MEHILSTWGLLAVFIVNAVSAMGIPAGSEWATIGAGALASGKLTSSGHPALWAVIVVAVVGDIVGSLAGYAIGRFGGRALVDRFGRYVLLSHRDLDRADAWFKRRGDPFVFFGRVIPLLRSFVSVAAGIGEMSVGIFVLFTTLGSAVFCVALCSAGYALGSSWHHILTDFSDAGYAVAAVIVVGVVLAAAHRIRSVSRQP
jgi:membrane protein DedA with SNARE-associated domain